MKRFTFFVIAFMHGLAVWAQDAAPAPKTFLEDPFNDPMLPLYLVMGFVSLVVVLVAAVALYLIRVLNMLTEQAEKEKAQELGVTYKPRPTWWDRFTQNMNASVPVEHEKNIELDHSYDGIKELDNHLPPWWKWLFYGTIGWSAVYIVIYHFSNTLPLSEQEYNHEVALAEEQAKKFKSAQPQVAIDESTLTFSNDQAIIEKGKTVFTNNNCGSCHRNDGGGNTIGPNLTDEYWIHGGHIKNIFSTIKNGAVEKGMPAWGKAMSPEDVRNVAFFIMSLQGTNPANAKAPQGEIFKQESTTLSTDSLKTQASL